jgi:hypothetical protein
MNFVTAFAPPVIALLIPLLVVVTVALTARRARGTDNPGESDGHGGNDGGRPFNPPPRSPRPSGSADPDWWPEFERAFTAHVRDHAAASRA